MLCDAMGMRSVDGSDSDGSIVAGLNNAYARLIGRVGRMLLVCGPSMRVSFLAGVTTLSLCIAIAAVVTPVIPGTSERSLFYVSYPLSVAWVAFVIFTMVRLRTRGLWALIGLPFAAYWPGIGALLHLACEWGHDCI